MQTPIHTHLHQSLQQSRYQFILLTGAAWSGKRELVTSIASEELGSSVLYDLLHIEDLSDNLGKKHTFAVKTPRTQSTLTRADGSTYHNLWAQELRDRLLRAPTQTKKIAIIENIERASIGAINALLKSLEEPLPGRYIIATTSSPQDVLPTIHSRALTLHMTQPSEEHLRQLLTQEYDISGDTSVYLQLSGQQVGRLRQLMTHGDRESIIQSYDEMLQLIDSWASVAKLFASLKHLTNQPHRQWYRDGLMQRSVDRGLWSVADALIQYDRHTSANIHAENALLQLAISCKP